MHYLLGGARATHPSWRHYFDIVVVSASKPDFYRGERPLVPLAADELQQAGLDAAGPPVHKGGSARHLKRWAGNRGDEVLYVGDHTFGDILRAKKRPGWRTAMLIEELHREIELDRTLGPEFQAVESAVVQRNQTIREVSRLQRRLQQFEGQQAEAAAPTSWPASPRRRPACGPKCRSCRRACRPAGDAIRPTKRSSKRATIRTGASSSSAATSTAGSASK